MKRFALYLELATVLVASCSIQEENFETPQQDDLIFYATFEQSAEDSTRVYVNEDLLLRWTADDRVSIFNKITYNQEYKFTGQTGANAGGFKKVDNDEFVTGNAISHVVSVYPYQESTAISESEDISLTLPAVQHYAENTFGLGANTMISVSEDNVLLYKNVGGYLVLKLYGEGVTVSSIRLKGNNGEKLAGKATVTMPLDGIPTAVLADDATDEITLVCDTPVELGATVEESKDFWFVVPPVTFSKGFTVSVSQTTGGVYEISTQKIITLERSNLSKMSPIKVEYMTIPYNVIYYTTSDEKALNFHDASFNAEIVSNEYVGGHGIITFDEDLTSIGSYAFYYQETLTSIILPDSVTSIGDQAFRRCSGLTSFEIPNSVNSIGSYVFSGCPGLTHMVIPKSLTVIGNLPFEDCSGLTSIVVESGNSVFDSRDNCNAIIKTDSNELIIGCNSSFIPDSVTSIGAGAFSSCSGLTSINIPDSVISIGDGAFQRCSGLTSFEIPYSVISIGSYVFSGCSGLTSIIVESGNSVYDSRDNCNAIIKTDSNELIIGCNSSFIPDSVTSIGAGAFSSCSGLISISIPDSVISIGDSAFSYCGFTSIIIPDSVTSIGRSAFSGCSSLTSIVLSNSITSIEDSMFFSSGLTSIVIPDSVTSIGARAFSWCWGLTSVVIPNSVASIGTEAFSVCNALESVTVLATTPPSLGDRVFGWGANMCFYVPAESIVLYRSKEGWEGSFRPITPMPGPVYTPEAVDLGLSVKWASFNLGASAPEGLGNYYAWGETEPKISFTWSNYKWCRSSTYMTRYNFSSAWGPVDNKYTFKDYDYADDAARQALGGEWRIPTYAEWTELMEECTWTWTDNYNDTGMSGQIVTSNKEGFTGNSIFLPAAYCMGENGFSEDNDSIGKAGLYWSSSLCKSSPDAACMLYFYENYVVGQDGSGGTRYLRFGGMSLRPVY